MAINTYRASSAYTITLASLATSAGLTVGRCSTSRSNATNKDEILAVAGQIMVGTTTTAGVIEVWVFAQRADGTWPDLFTTTYSGTDGGFTVRSRDVLLAGAVLVSLPMTVAASLTNVPFSFGPRDLSMLFGYPPKEHALFVTHSSGVALNSTGGNHSIDLSAAYY
jgi:hypothetical protein